MIPRNKPCSQAEHTRVALRVHTALAMFGAGQATLEEWRDLSDGINIIEALCDLGKLDSEEHGDMVVAAIGGMVEAVDTYRSSGKMEPSQTGFENVKRVINKYDEALAKFSETTLAKAQSFVIVKVAQAKATPSQSVTVIDL